MGAAASKSKIQPIPDIIEEDQATGMAPSTTNNLRESYKVTQTNALIEASYRLTLEEKRLILAAISVIDPRNDIPPKITISASDYAKIFDLKMPAAYQQLKDASDRLYQREIHIKGANKDVSLRWIYEKAVYHQGHGAVSLSFSPTLHPHLSNLSKGNFTSYTIENVKTLKSTYSIRLFELLMQYKKEGKRFITINDFRNMFELNDKYQLYSELRRCVIEPAIEELNKKSFIEVRYKPEKKNKSVVNLWFYFEEKKQMDLLAAV
ncbi:MAG: replication initiation protein [Gammaproteobacteria bacterium]|nr:replication initiation protein [Gammaproteobacteria bacterium]